MYRYIYNFFSSPFNISEYPFNKDSQYLFMHFDIKKHNCSKLYFIDIHRLYCYIHYLHIFNLYTLKLIKFAICDEYRMIAFNYILLYFIKRNLGSLIVIDRVN